MRGRLTSRREVVGEIGAELVGERRDVVTDENRIAVVDRPFDIGPECDPVEPVGEKVVCRPVVAFALDDVAVAVDERAIAVGGRVGFVEAVGMLARAHRRALVSLDGEALGDGEFVEEYPRAVGERPRAEHVEAVVVEGGANARERFSSCG